MARHSIPANDAVRAARRGTAILAAIPGLLILPIMGALFLFGPSQTQARKDTIKQAWTKGGGEGATLALSHCMQNAGYGGDINLVLSYFMLYAVEECEKDVLKLAKARAMIGSAAHSEGAASAQDIEGAARERKRVIDGVI